MSVGRVLFSLVSIVRTARPISDSLEGADLRAWAPYPPAGQPRVWMPGRTEPGCVTAGSARDPPCRGRGRKRHTFGGSEFCFLSPFWNWLLGQGGHLGGQPHLPCPACDPPRCVYVACRAGDSRLSGKAPVSSAPLPPTPPSPSPVRARAL